MHRYIRIYKAIVRINGALLFAYRASFINGLISSFCWGAFNFVWIILLTHKGQSVFGWKSEELVFITVSYVIVTGFFYALSAHNFTNLARIIDRGELDGILLKPLDSQFQISLMRIAFGSLIRVVMGGIFIVWWAAHNGYSIGLFQVVGYLALLMVGIIILYSIWLLCMTCLIWYPNLGNLVELMFTFNGFARYPTELIQKSGIGALLIFFPISLICATPVKTLLQQNDWGNIGFLIGFGIGLFYLSRQWWKYALKYYTSAS